MNEPIQPELKLFVSHSSKDIGIVKPLVELLRLALNLRAEDIRCTSVDGYRLPGGADTNEHIRRESLKAKTFVGVISTASLESMYVIFEIGARWGAGKHLLPVLIPGTDASILTGPLSGINALRCDRGQLHQLITDLAKELDVTPEPPAVYQDKIEKIVQHSYPVQDEAVTGETNDIEMNAKVAKPELSDLEINILSIMAVKDRASANLIASILKINVQKIKFHLDELTRQWGFLDWVGNMNPGVSDYYRLTHEGRRFLNERNLL